MAEIIQGIYKIENKNTGKVYIGQSKDISMKPNVVGIQKKHKIPL